MITDSKLTTCFAFKPLSPEALSGLTSSLLVFCSIISTGHKHFGSPIHCNLDSEAKVSLAAFQSFCFMEGTYTLLVDQATMANTSTLHHGLGHGLGKDDSGSLHQNYYIWANLIMVLMVSSAH